MIQINNRSDAYVLQHSVSVTQLLGDENSLFSVYSEERNGSRAVQKKSFKTESLFHVTVTCLV